MDSPQILPATIEDFSHIWPFFSHTINNVDAFCMPASLDEATARSIWFAKNHHIFKLVLNNKIIGTIMLRPNFGGHGNHSVANATFMIDNDCRGRGYGRLIGQFAIDEAKRQGYTAMQFNSVVSTNERALKLWQSLGFKIIGTVPLAYRHSKLGFVDTHIMHRFL